MSALCFAARLRREGFETWEKLWPREGTLPSESDRGGEEGLTAGFWTSVETRTQVFSPDEGSCYVISIQKNCCDWQCVLYLTWSETGK